MKYLLSCLMVWLICTATACTKTGVITNPTELYLSTDTIHFDTVFTSIGSITQSFKVFNRSSQSLQLSQLNLMGGDSSNFRVNVDGAPGTAFHNITILPNDSIYVFVSVTIDPGNQLLPFLVTDSLSIVTNNSTRFVQLRAYGQNAVFLNNKHVRTDTTFSNSLPIVILGGLTVDSSATLTLSTGTKIYFHADAPFIVNGRLQANGGPQQSERIILSGDRLDPVYNGLPAAWPGILFNLSSVDNGLNYVTIKNAYQGATVYSSAPTGLALNGCIIDNMYTTGLSGYAANITAANCLITNCGNNLMLRGGNYSFVHCTIAAIGNLYVAHKSPTVTLTNQVSQNTTSPLYASFVNSIIYGEGGSTNNEIDILQKGTPAPADFNVIFKNVLYKSSDPLQLSVNTNNLPNVAPMFDSLNAYRRFFSFRLKPGSPAIDAGTPTQILTDIEGKPRTPANKPDLGCYEQ